MLLIRTKRVPALKKKKLVQLSAHTIGVLIQSLLLIVSIPAMVIWSGLNFWESVKLVLKYIHLIIPVIVAIIWIVRAILNIGQGVQQQ